MNTTEFEWHDLYGLDDVHQLLKLCRIEREERIFKCGGGESREEVVVPCFKLLCQNSRGATGFQTGYLRVVSQIHYHYTNYTNMLSRSSFYIIFNDAV
jgi:hypothetical protein